MFDALHIAAVGLQAQKEQLDASANNLANVGTTAFKRQSIDFSAILDRAPAGAALDAPDAGSVRPSRVVRLDLSGGEVRDTGRALDVAILGRGFFEVELADGRSGYSRAGSLQIDANGVLTLANGRALKGDIRIPSDASDVAILADGAVSAVLPGDTVPSVLGQIELAVFENPDSLQYHGDGLFTAPDDGMEPLRLRPGENGAAELASRSLEASNVSMVAEMVSLLLVQRIYELNSRVAQTADELMGMSNNLRRS